MDSTFPAADAAQRVSVRGRPATRRLAGGVLASLGYGVVTFLFLLPFVWLILTSFKPTDDVFRFTVPLNVWTFLPPTPTLRNYASIFGTFSFYRYMLNTLIVAAGQVIGVCVISSLAAFVFARMRFRGRDLLFALAMLTAFVPFDVVVVPLYLVVKSLGLVSTYPGIFLPFVVSPFGVFLMRQAFLEIPRDLDEAATLEGASLFRIFWSIIVPNSGPALATLALVQFLWSWNSYLWPLVIMQDPEKQVVQVASASFRSMANFPLFGEMFAALSSTTVPVLVVFLLLQRYYVRGMFMSGLK